MDRAAPSILVVEDDLVIADLIEQILRVAGNVVRHVADGQAAIDALEQTPPALVLMDLMLPVLSGVAASRAIKGSPCPAVAQVPIVAMSAGVNLRNAAVTLPVDGLLAKPFDIDALLATVARYLSPVTQAA